MRRLDYAVLEKVSDSYFRKCHEFIFLTFLYNYYIWNDHWLVILVYFLFYPSLGLPLFKSEEIQELKSQLSNVREINLSDNQFINDCIFEDLIECLPGISSIVLDGCKIYCTQYDSGGGSPSPSRWLFHCHFLNSKFFVVRCISVIEFVKPKRGRRQMTSRP